MNSENRTAYPLSWPINQPKPPAHSRRQSRFGEHSVPSCVRLILHEVQLAGGRDTLISTNVELRQDGLPRGNQRIPEDPGAAVYFKMKGKDVALACGQWSKVEHNLYAIAKHIEAMRGQARWGVGTTDQQWRGYQALPDVGGTSGIQWWIVMGFKDPNLATTEEIRSRFRQLALTRHPDKGGSTNDWNSLQTAFRQALQAKGEAQ